MKKTTKRRLAVALSRTASAALATVCLAVALSSAVPAQAATAQDLQQQLAQYEQKLQEDKEKLQQMQDNTANAEAKQQNLENQVSIIKSQIEILAQSISEVQNSIGEKEQEITAKQADIDQKQADIDTQLASFKARMAAMQELHDSGTLAMLASVNSLYELLTFSEVLQDISNKDTEIMNGLKQQKSDLETAKAELENAKTQMEAQQTELESEKNQMQTKQTQLSSALAQAGKDVQAAQAEEDAAQALLDSDQMNYEAVYAAIQDLVQQAEGNYSDLQFDGSFACPLKSYKYISSRFGYRTLGGVTKLHPGVDFSAESGTPIYAAASGYVTAAGWNSGGYGYYVLVYHGTMNDGNTYSTLYAHMVGAPSVSVGQYVTQGTVLGGVGNTGNSSGNHLHLEVWQGSSASNSIANKANRVDPLLYIPT